MSFEINGVDVKPISVNEAADGSGSEHRLVCDSNGLLQVVVSGAVTAVDDGSIPAGQTVPLNIVSLYGYDSGGGALDRLQTDGSGKLKVYTP